VRSLAHSRLRTRHSTKVEGALVSLDEAEDLVIEVKAWVPDQRPVAEDPQHHVAVPLSDTSAISKNHPYTMRESWMSPKSQSVP
jgi:hypothetical protein